MYKIKIQFADGTIRTYKTYYRRTLKVKASSLIPSMLLSGLSVKDDKGRELKAFDYFGCKVLSFEKVDGRLKEIKRLFFFSFSECKYYYLKK